MLSAISRRLSVARILWRRLGLNDYGSIATAFIAVPVIAGAVAIGVETGQLYRVKRQMQTAADAAALAASVDKINGNTGSITATALYEAQRNGFTNGVNGVVVAANATPSGANAGTPGAVQVTITKTQSFSLGAAILGATNGHLGLMKATALAAQGSNTTTATTTSPVTTSTTTAEGCIIALTPNNEQGISITSFNNFTSDCSIMSNGTATGTGSSASITMSSFNNATVHSTDSNAARVWTRGTFSKSSYNNFTADSILQNQASSITDPYSSLATPSPGSCTYTNYAEPSGSNLTVNPGTYCGGLTVQNKSNVYFTPGTYYIANGDLIIRSDNNVSCPTCTAANGVTFVLTQTTGSNTDIGGVSITSENNVTLNAGSSSATNTFPGVLFYQDRRVAAGTMASTSKIFTVASLNNATLSGAVYFPQNRIDISSINNIGGSPTTGCTIWVGRYIKFSSYNNNYKGGCSTYGTTPAGITTTTTTTQTTTTSTTTTRNRVME